MLEVTRAQKARLGLFLIISGSLLIVLLLIVTGTKFFEKRDQYFIRYRDVSVSGVEVGAQIKYHGVRVGRVDEIRIDEEEVETIVVTLSLKRGTPVKTDVEAEITALSLTGLKIIELTGGSSDAPLLPPDSEIPAGESALQMITGRAEAVSEKLEMVLNNLISLTGGENRQRFMNLIDNTAAVLEDVHIMLAESRDPIASTINNLELASQDIRAITSSVEIQRTLANLDSASRNLNETDLANTLKILSNTFEQARLTFNHIDLTLLKGRHDLLISLEVLRESLDSFNEFSRMISEDPSLLLRGTREGEIGIRGRR